MNEQEARILKGLSACSERGKCTICPYHQEGKSSGSCVETLSVDALNLIKRKNAEIDGLKSLISELSMRICSSKEDSNEG